MPISLALMVLLPLVPPRANAHPPACPADNAGLTLPAGFCATLFADQLGVVRQLTALPNGDILAATGGPTGGVYVLRDTNGDGKADIQNRFGPSGGNGITWGGGYLYFANTNQVMRWPWKPGQTQPSGAPELIVTDLPVDGNHTTKSLALGADGALYVSVGSATNSCQESDRSRGSKGRDPCTELQTRAGIWKFSASKQGQRQSDGELWATGIRNAVALTADPTSGKIYAASHGRDQLGDNWGFNDSLNAELPGEEFFEAHRGTDIGWPYCYYDQLQGKKVLAPEYGGDGKAVGKCAGKQAPLIGFPGHWAPMAIAFYTKALFPAAYRNGAFIAFHGSWNRAPLPQAGYRVVFVPFADGKPTGKYDTFATLTGKPTGFRPAGLAVGSDGALYIGADAQHQIWRVVPQK